MKNSFSNSNQYKCSICSGEFAISQRDFPGFRKGTEFDICFCMRCGCSFASPKSEDTSELYNLIYSHSKNLSGYRRYEIYRQIMKYSPFPDIESLASVEDCYWGLLQAIRSHEKNGKKKEDLKILEIGSGLGYTTYALRKSGYDVLGYDISSKAVQSATKDFGPYYSAVPFEKLKEQYIKGFDIIFLTEVIEHISEPVAFMESLLALLKVDGCIILTTPNRLTSSNDEVWAVTEPPVHYWWFSPKSIDIIAERIGLHAKYVDFRPINKAFAPKKFSGQSLPGGALNVNGSLAQDYFDHKSISDVRDYAKIIAKMILRRKRGCYYAAELIKSEDCALWGVTLCAVLMR
jgi:SAM-dependent methyltransferase